MKSEKPKSPKLTDRLASNGDVSDKPNYRVGALAKGLRVMALFDDHRPVWTITDLAAAAEVPLPTVYRIVMTLVGEGYLDQLPTGEYRPAVKALTLGTSALRSLDLVTIATPRLQHLAKETGETVNLAVLDGADILYLIRLRNADLVTANIQVGSRLPAAHTSIGKLLLATAPEGADHVALGDTSPTTLGPNAITSANDLERELATIRNQGWSMQDEELAYGLRSVAAPIRDSTDTVVAGVNLAVQAQEYSVRQLSSDLLPKLVEVCAQISGLLGAPTAKVQDR